MASDGENLHVPLVEDSESTALVTDTDADGNDDSVEALKARLAAQQELLNAVLSGAAAPSSGMPGFGNSASAAPVVAEPPTRRSESDSERLLSSPTGPDTTALIHGGDVGHGATAAADFDMRLAQAMQQEEMMVAAREAATADRDQPDEPPTLEDPVWGKFVAPPNGHKPHQVLCISMCPCCVGPYCSSERKSTYKRVALTASFILSAAQLALVVASLFFRGFAPPKVNPMLGPWPDTLNLMGAKNAALIVYKYQLWRLVTPMMLHAGFIHLGTNLVMQLRLAIFLEVKWGLRRFLAVYFFAGVFSALWSTVMIPTSIGVGASGALMGILGAWFIDILAEWGEGEAHMQQQRSFMLVMCFVNMLVILGFSAVPMIDWAAHAFGMLGGLLLTMWITRDKWQGRWRAVMTWGGLGGFIFMCILGLVLIYTSKPPKVLEDICGELAKAYPHDVHC